MVEILIFHVLYKPTIQTNKAIIMLHGGPSDSWKATWSPIIHSLTSNNYNVFLANPRGSIIRDYPLPMIAKGDLGVKDSYDIGKCIGWLIDSGYAKDGGIGLYGHSYGGFLANQVLKTYESKIECIAITSSYYQFSLFVVINMAEH
ncbi:alpha/beta hydrolase family protein [Peribacillus sp. NPDC097675]|uniref:alpha/beta hydrolase family protein n=1 Tax=Peribacillus sp. NPDC097675 TaxID=3390618 RepID=UPI003D0249A5